LIEQAPERINAAVACQPIGLAGNRDAFRAIFDDWRSVIGDDHPEASDDDWESFWSNLFGGENILWSVPDEFVASINTPILVLQGDDEYHPKEASRWLAATAPSATLVERWKEPADQPAAKVAVDNFLAANGS